MHFVAVRDEHAAHLIAMPAAAGVIAVVAAAFGGLDVEAELHATGVGGVLGAAWAMIGERRRIRSAREARFVPTSVVDIRRHTLTVAAAVAAAGALLALIAPWLGLVVAVMLLVLMPPLMWWQSRWYRNFERISRARIMRERGLRWGTRYVLVPWDDAERPGRTPASARAGA
jgi:phosphatidylserine synthase